MATALVKWRRFSNTGKALQEQFFIGRISSTFPLDASVHFYTPGYPWSCCFHHASHLMVKCDCWRIIWTVSLFIHPFSVPFFLHWVAGEPIPRNSERKEMACLLQVSFLIFLFEVIFNLSRFTSCHLLTTWETLPWVMWWKTDTHNQNAESSGLGWRVGCFLVQWILNKVSQDFEMNILCTDLSYQSSGRCCIVVG